jgi:REP-associated tyrosine transposase
VRAPHCGLRDDTLLSGDCPVVAEIENWSEWLTIEDGKAVEDVIRLHTRTGRPLGSKEFVGRIELQKGRKLLPQKRGSRLKSEPPTTGRLFG